MAKIFLIQGSILLSILCFPAFAEPLTGEAFSFYLENDTRKIGGPGTDESYSNGFRFAYVFAQDRVPNWAPIIKRANKSLREKLEKAPSNFGFSFGQQVFTPDDTRAPGLIKKDRPYAGYLSVGFNATVQIDDVCELFSLELGTIGPDARGEEVQNGFHRMIGIADAEGWDNQLENEPTIQLAYQRRFRTAQLFVRSSKNFDVIPFVGVALGNVVVSAHTGLIARVGVNIPDDFGPSRPSATDGDIFTVPKEESKLKGWGFYAFGGLRGNAVARNIFLDGNTFVESHRVERNPWVAENELGWGAHLGRMSLIWRYVTRTPEFTENTRTDSFASVSLHYYHGL
ncbi:MAG: lipid A deacylase LpxR family protein [Bdellovibrio sp.]